MIINENSSGKWDKKIIINTCLTKRFYIMLPIMSYEENIRHLSTLKHCTIPLVTSHAQGEILSSHYFIFRFICFMKRNREKDNVYSLYDKCGHTPEEQCNYPYPEGREHLCSSKLSLSYVLETP